MTKTANIDQTASVTTARNIPAITPQAVTPQSGGHCFRTFMIRLPQGMIADDLKEPSLWRKVQLDRNRAFIRHDHLYIVAFDESWVAEAIVAEATATAATLAVTRIVSFPERLKPLFQDDRYKVIWSGDGYRVERKADGVMMTNAVPNEALAERDLARLYPTPA